MHISEGILPGGVLAAGAVLTVAGVGIGLRRTDYERIPSVAVLGSAFFVASLIRVPIGPVHAHLVLNGLMGLILGWSAVPVILVALLLQALLFMFGGLTVLGVNTVIMAAPAVAIGYLFGRGVRSNSARISCFAAFAAGSGAVVLGALLTAGTLLTAGKNFTEIAGVVTLAHVPIILIEGAVTVSVIGFLRKVRPELLAAN